jgi:hypothetical protein
MVCIDLDKLLAPDLICNRFCYGFKGHGYSLDDDCSLS